MALHRSDTRAPSQQAMLAPNDEGQQTGLLQFVRLIARSWPLVVSAVALGVIGAGAVSMLVRPEYHSSTRVLVGTCAEGSIEQAYQCGMFTKDRALSYASLVTSDLLAQRVIDDLRLDRSSNDVASKITATAEPETALIEITVSDPDAAEARRMADSAARQFVQMVAEVELRNTGEQDNPFTNLTVVEAAKEAATSGATTEMNLAFGAIGGLLIGVIAAIVRDRLDTKIRSADQIPPLGLTVLGEAPHTDSMLWVDDGDERTEAFRRLRVKIGGYGHVVTVVGTRSAKGASMAAIDLARAAAEAGAKVALVNGDMRGGGPALGLASTDDGLAQLLSEPDRAPVMASALPSWSTPAVHVLGAGVVPDGTSASALLASGRLSRVLDSLRDAFDLVVLYCAPVLESADATIVGVVADAAILVVDAGRTTGEDASAAADTLRSVGASMLGAFLVTDRSTARTKQQAQRR